MANIKNLLEFFNQRIIRDANYEKIPCEESMKYAEKWLAERGSTVKDLNAKEWYEKAIKDQEMPIHYRNRLDLLVQEPRAIIAALGRQGVEDAGEYRVNYYGMIHLDEEDTEDDGRLKTKYFTSKEDAAQWVDTTIKEYWGREDWIFEVDIIRQNVPYEFYEDGKLVETGFANESVTYEEIFEAPKDEIFIVKNDVKTYYKEVTVDDVLQAREECIQATYNEYKKGFVMWKRIKPKGDPVWGNWWIRVNNF